jgi:hypothetical protein
VWAEEDEDEFAGITGYFKLVEGTLGQTFDPLKIDVFRNYFYWGYSRDLDVSDFVKMSQLIADDFRKLLATYPIGAPPTRKTVDAEKPVGGKVPKARAAPGRRK